MHPDAQGSIPRLLLKVPEACQATGLSRTVIYQLVGSGEIESIHVGAALRIPVESLERWVSEKRSEAREAAAV